MSSNLVKIRVSLTFRKHDPKQQLICFSKWTTVVDGDRLLYAAYFPMQKVAWFEYQTKASQTAA